MSQTHSIFASLLACEILISFQISQLVRSKKTALNAPIFSRQKSAMKAMKAMKMKKTMKKTMKKMAMKKGECLLCLIFRC